MGVDGLKKSYDSITNKVHLSKFRGGTLVVDASGLLYRYLKVCDVEGIARAQNEGSQLTYIQVEPCISAVVSAVLQVTKGLDMKVVLVTDGDRRNKVTSNSNRSSSRQDAFNKAEAEQNPQKARRLFQQAVFVGKEFVRGLIHACEDKAGVTAVQSPYEADAQLAKLSEVYDSDNCVVVSNDGDLPVQGCRNVLFDLGLKKSDANFQFANLLCLDDVFTHDKSPYKDLTQIMLCCICILAGCDYCEGINGVGLAKATALVKAVSDDNNGSFSLDLLCTHISEKTTFVLPEGFRADAQRALYTYQHQVVIDPNDFMLKHLTPPAADVDMSFLGSCEGNESTVSDIYEGRRDANTREEWEDSSHDFFPPPDDNHEHHVKAIDAARKMCMALVDTLEKKAQLVAEVKQIRDTKKAEIEALRLTNPYHPDVKAFDWRDAEFDKMIRVFREGRETDAPLDRDMIDAQVMAIMKRYPDAAINICKVTRGEGGIPKNGEEKRSITDTSRQVLPLRNVNGKDGVHIKDEDLLREGVPLPDGEKEEDVTHYLWIPLGEPTELDSKSYEGEAIATLAALDIADGSGMVLNKNFFGRPTNEEGQLHEFGVFVILGYKARLADKTWGISRGLPHQVTRSIMQNLGGVDFTWLDPPSRGVKQHTYQPYAVSTSEGIPICNPETLTELQKLISTISTQFLSRAEKASLRETAKEKIQLSASIIGDGRAVKAIEYNDEVITIRVGPFIEGKTEGKPGDIMNQELLSALLGSKRSYGISYIIFVGEELNLDSIVAMPIGYRTAAGWLRVGESKVYPTNLEMGVIYPMCSVDEVGGVNLCLYNEKEHIHLGQPGDILNVGVLDKIRSRTVESGGAIGGTTGVLSIFNRKKEAETHEPMGIAIDNTQSRAFIGGNVTDYTQAELLAGQAVTGTMAVGDLYTQEYNPLDGEYDPVEGALFERASIQNPAFAERVIDKQEKFREKARKKEEKKERAKNRRLGIDKTEEPDTSSSSKRLRRSTRKD